MTFLSVCGVHFGLFFWSTSLVSALLAELSPVLMSDAPIDDVKSFTNPSGPKVTVRVSCCVSVPPMNCPGEGDEGYRGRTDGARVGRTVTPPTGRAFAHAV